MNCTKNGTEHYHAELQDISWHNKGGVGTLSLQQLYKDIKKYNNKQTKKQRRDGDSELSKIVQKKYKTNNKQRN